MIAFILQFYKVKWNNGFLESFMVSLFQFFTTIVKFLFWVADSELVFRIFRGLLQIFNSLKYFKIIFEATY